MFSKIKAQAVKAAERFNNYEFKEKFNNLELKEKATRVVEKLSNFVGNGKNQQDQPPIPKPTKFVGNQWGTTRERPIPKPRTIFNTNKESFMVSKDYVIPPPRGFEDVIIPPPREFRDTISVSKKIPPPRPPPPNVRKTPKVENLLLKEELKKPKKFTLLPPKSFKIPTKIIGLGNTKKGDEDKIKKDRAKLRTSFKSSIEDQSIPVRPPRPKREARKEGLLKKTVSKILHETRGITEIKVKESQPSTSFSKSSEEEEIKKLEKYLAEQNAKKDMEKVSETGTKELTEIIKKEEEKNKHISDVKFEKQPHKFGESYRSFRMEIGKQHMGTMIDMTKGAIYRALLEEIKIFGGIRFQIAINPSFEKENVDGETEYVFPPFASGYRGLLVPKEVRPVVEDSLRQINSNIDNFVRSGSGWIFDSVDEVFLRTIKYEPGKGGSYIPTPKWISNKRAVVNVKNKDQKCFRWALKSALFPVEKNSDRVTSYPSDEDTILISRVLNFQ